MNIELDRYGHLIGWRERRDRLHPDQRPEITAMLRSIMECLEAPKY